VEVFVNAPLEICERRDTKGIYAKARRGEMAMREQRDRTRETYATA